MELKKVYWEDVRKRVQGVCPELAKLMDALSPGKDLPLYTASYPYGAVMDDGVFYYPHENQLAPLNKMPAGVQKDFGYAADLPPVGLVLSNSLELSIDSPVSLSTAKLLKPGGFFALWGHLNRLQQKVVFCGCDQLHITSGVRSIFILPNIGNEKLHTQLKADLNVRFGAPKTLRDHWRVFREIAASTEVECNWQSEVLLFTTTWLERLRSDDPMWRSLLCYFFQKAWNESDYERNHIIYDLTFSMIQAKRNLKPNPYLSDTAKHILAVASGARTGFSPELDERFAPMSLLQEAYLNSYNLNGYYPYIFHPDFVDETKSQMVYYSLVFPTTFEFSPKSRKVSNTILDMVELKHVLSNLLKDLHPREMEHVAMKKEFADLGLNFFHSKPDRYGEILNSRSIPEYDPFFSEKISDKGEPLSFAASAPFVRGCVQIQLKNAN